MSKHAKVGLASLLQTMTLLSACVAVAPSNDDSAAADTATPAAQSPTATDTSSTSFRAVGQEPGWLLTISDSLRLQWDYDARKLAVATPTVQSSGGERRYEFTHQDTSFSIRVTDTPCADAMSGHQYPSTVTVNIGARVLNGCGGEPGAMLQGAEWMVESIEGNAVASNVVITMQFSTDGRISGKVCNRYSGSYSTNGNTLTTSQVISTKMACTPEIDRYETQLLSILGSPVQFHIDNNVLTIARDRTPVVTARRK